MRSLCGITAFLRNLSGDSKSERQMKIICYFNKKPLFYALKALRRSASSFLPLQYVLWI